MSRFCLIRFGGTFAEDGWLRYILSEVAHDVHLAEDFLARPDYGYQGYIVLFSSNHETPQVAQIFDDLKRRGKTVGVFLLSDEWCRYCSDLYARADFFLRTHFCDFIKGDNLMYVPLGPPRYAPQEERTITKSSERPYSWFFAGHSDSSRTDMLRAMRRVEPYLLPQARIAKTEFDAALAASVFAPCPMGNVSLETWRFYEALEAGCIPIVEKRLTVDYYKSLLGAHPIPTFLRWRDAADWALATKGSPELDSLQAEISQWWKSKKAGLPHAICSFIDACTRPEGQADRNRRYASSTFIHSLKWKVYCLRMANMTSFRRRAISPSQLAKLLTR